MEQVYDDFIEHKITNYRKKRDEDPLKDYFETQRASNKNFDYEEANRFKNSLKNIKVVKL